MQAIIEPSNISGNIIPPPSKSMSQRAIAGALLHRGKTIIHHYGNADDERAIINAIQQFGATIAFLGNDIAEIRSQGPQAPAQPINCRESGLASRLMVPIAAMLSAPVTITGSGTLMNRPVTLPSSVLEELGVTMTSANGHLPVTICGPMQPNDITIDASESSQLLSGLLFAYCYAAKSKSTIHVTKIASRPYIDMTLAMLESFGRPVIHHQYQDFYIEPKLFGSPKEVIIDIETDWSASAALLIAGVIAGNMTLRQMNFRSLQADSAVLQVLQAAGARILKLKDTVTIESCNLVPFEFDATDCPDLFPVLCILAACCDGESYIYGVHRLFHKESNRVSSIAEMLWAFQVPFIVEDDAFCINGVDSFAGANIDTCNDHRIAMAAAIGALRATGSVTLNNVDCVKKSYPNFFRDMILSGMVCNFTEA